MSEQPNDDKPDRKYHLDRLTLTLSGVGIMISGIISFTQIFTTWLQNQQELKIQSLQKQKELQIQNLKNEGEAKLGRGQLIFANIEKLKETLIKTA